MSIENFRYSFYPLGAQIAISYVTSRHNRLHSQIGFLVSLAIINLPIAIIALVYRFIGHEWALFMEMWLNCATILQCCFYYSFEHTIILSPGFYVVLFTVYMNEATFVGGDWFGHQVISFMSVFVIMKILISTCSSSQQVWAGLIMIEFCVMCALPLLFLWTMPAVEWYIPIFLMSVPLAYPTCNAEISPSKPQRGLIALAPTVQFQMLKNEESEE
jgi:hypothetical protein